jgi:hypothetical protein
LVKCYMKNAPQPLNIYENNPLNSQENNHQNN